MALPRLFDVVGIEVLDLDELELSGELLEVSEVNIHFEQFVYLIYIFGFIGKFKGVVVAHGAIVLYC